MVFQNVRFYEPESAKVLAEAEETLRYLFPYDFRSDSTSQNATRIHLISEGRVLTAVDEKIVANQETSFDLYKDILLYRTRELLQQRLTSLGIDTSLTCLGRFKGRIAIVLGSEKPNEPVSQVWVDKETLQPMRWRIVSDSRDMPPKDVEIRYDEWRQVNKTWYPMVIGVYNNGALEREIHVKALRVNSSFPQRLFDTQLMEVQYLQSVAESPDQSVDGELSEIEKTINEFRKRIEE
jgi:outer membrane lipoprotein-sorting protein